MLQLQEVGENITAIRRAHNGLVLSTPTFSPLMLSFASCQARSLSLTRATFLTIRVERLQPLVDAVVALLNLVQDLVVKSLQLERGRIFNFRDTADKQVVRGAGKNTLSCQPRVQLVMHELFHSHRHLLVAVFEQLKSARFGDAVDFPYAAKQSTFEVPEIPQGCGVDVQRLLRRGKGLCLLFPSEEVKVLAARGQSVVQNKRRKRRARQGLRGRTV